MYIRRIACIIFLFFIIPLFSCTPKPVIYNTGAAIAVWDLDNLSTFGVTHDLGEPLSARIIETIKENKGYPIVERERLLLALEEMHLSSSSLADEETRLRLGRLAGARFMVFGGYQIINEMMRVDLRLVDVESGKVLKAAQKTTSAKELSGWLKIVSEAALELL